jgi:hypothetical protein
MTLRRPTTRFSPMLCAAALCLALGASAAAPVFAQDAVQAEKAQIESQRRAAEERYRARERECRDRFIVTSCVEDAQRQRRATLDALRARQLKLDEARRRTRAAERQAEIAEKMAEDARRIKEGQERAARPQAAPRELREAREPREPRQPRAARAPVPDARASGVDRGRRGAAAVDDPAARRTREERSRAVFEERQRKAAEHRASSLERTIKRMHERDPATSLPLPAASAVDGSRPASAP